MNDDLRGRPGTPGPPRVTLQHPSELEPDRSSLYADIANGPRRNQQTIVPLTDTEGRLLGPFGLMLISPAIGAAVQQLGAALRFDKILPTRTRELAILAIAAHRQSQFEWLAHENAARAAGITDLQLQALLDGEEPKGMEDAELTALRVVKQLLANGELDDEGYVRAESNLGTESVAVIVWLVGYYEMLATALATFRPPLHAKDQK